MGAVQADGHASTTPHHADAARAVIALVKRSLVPVAACATLLAACPLAAWAQAPAAQRSGPDCPPPKWMAERLDYYNPNDQMRIKQVEGNHFDPETEALIRGKTGTTPGYDIEFLVRYVPNHPRGLASLVRLSLRDRTPRPVGVSLHVECYLLRALEFRAEDPEVEKIYGSYLSRLGRHQEALQHFKAAESLAPNDMLIAYNIGLAYVELKDFDKARSYARKAYAGGIALPGLRDKLARAGELRD
jgi:tetratricopeptide (TPR) repeat protein